MKPRHRRTSIVYQIVVQDLLDPMWSDWFYGFEIAPQDDGTTVLQGPISDQAALHGALNKIRDIGLSIISVRRMPDSQWRA